MARATDDSTDQSDKPKIHVTRNGEIYVTAKDVVKSKKFQEQIKRWPTSVLLKGRLSLVSAYGISP